MADYATLKRVLEHGIKQQEARYGLMDEALHTRVWLQSQPTERVCLFFHGFTAGPYQMERIGQHLYRAGYNVVAPLLPGHGRAGHWGKDNPPPLPTDFRVYQNFGLQWLNLVSLLGDRVVVGGLSGGGTLASWLALEKPAQVDRAVLCAPYLSASSKVIDLFVKRVDTYFAWAAAPKQIVDSATAAQAPPLGYSGFTTPALRAVLELGQLCQQRVKQSAIAPTFTISSESDRAVSNVDHQHFFAAALNHQPISWYVLFNKVLDIPHTMMTAQEGNRYQHLLNVMIQAFVESDLAWAEVEEIAYRMTKNRTFNQVVAELGWQTKVSKDMPAMVTMVDKWAIAVKRELEGRQMGGRSPRDR
ncbi:alpha/beta fold hydrolase [Nodosilinea sp. LEGE 06152]|uniref:alpha/beta hydrolase n=1 Tax=Nodosilinea sp. LEGE 06152 TaxID=2777966 RepID=UPI001882A945|nr:alpha/beta fold hydrolase [Nodosilinea sp. LEGE 06152]MBE9158346.1 alpha/beta fold hydrolase [Nodosilinea sp. LEGE 06152]